MTILIVSFRITLVLIGMFWATSCSAINNELEIHLVGSTPGEESIKSMLSISADANIDFIKWDLKLDSKKAFLLNITYGESQPNTLDFRGDGEKKIIKGKYFITINQDNPFKEVYRLMLDDSPEKISLLKLSENTFHILTFENKLMIGNGGWSYSLNRKEPIDSGKILISSPMSDNKSLQIVFDGRTPCQEFVTEYPEMNASPSCVKLKWKLILNRDSLTYLPTTCIIRNIVDNQPRDIIGKWEIIKGTKTNPNAIVYSVEVDNLTEPILLLVGDENVLYFLDKKRELLTGNENFSFALNKRI